MDKHWNILLVDKSASMLINFNTVKKGIENLIKEQIETGSTNRFTLIAFSSDVVEIKDEYFPDVSPLEDSQILGNGTTALYDAIGYVYEKIIESSEVNVVFTIITDGYENSSKLHDSDSINKLKDEINKTKKVNVTFIGSDANCISTNSSIILKHANSSMNCEGDFNLALKTASRTMSNAVPDTIHDVNVNVKIDTSFSNEQMPFIKRQASYIIPPPNSSCKRYCCLFH